VQSLWSTPLLPPFGAWYSGTLSYGILVLAQLLIILAVAFTTVRIFRHRLKPKRNVGLVLLVLGAVYMLASIFHLAAGLSFLTHLTFFNSVIPAVFHLVLAGIVLTLGHFTFTPAGSPQTPEIDRALGCLGLSNHVARV